MAFNFFGFKKRHDIEDVVPKEEVPTLPPQEDLKALDTASVAPVVEPEVATQDVSALPKEIEPLVANELSKGLVTTREDVIAAYKIFLGRMPESEDVITLWLSSNPEAVLAGFLKSQEFLSHPQKAPFILALAKKILDDRKQAESSTESSLKNSFSDRSTTQRVSHD